VTLDNISNLLKEVAIKKNIQNEHKVDISIDCTLAKTNETTTVLSRIKELKEEMNQI